MERIMEIDSEEFLSLLEKNSDITARDPILSEDEIDALLGRGIFRINNEDDDMTKFNES
jgi:hypothetical protein